MAGSLSGGKKAAATNIKKYGPDFYATIGAMGGKLGRTGGFYANRELAVSAGRTGGRKSRRNRKYPYGTGVKTARKVDVGWPDHLRVATVPVKVIPVKKPWWKIW